MRTEGLRRILLPVLLILTLVFSTAFIPTPVLADAVISYPGHPSQPQNIFDVPPGQTFTLRHRLRWDEGGVPGYYLVAIYWDYYADNAYHFTLDGVSTYFDNNGDNLPDGGVALIDNSVSTADNGTRYSIAVSTAAGNDNDGTFNVDITLRAAGPNDTLHSPTDNHPIYYTIVQSLESIPPDSVLPTPITVRVLTGGVEVSISPDYQSGLSGSVLDYTVTVINTGDYEDNYDLVASDDAGWGPTLSENLLTVPAGENLTATLSVTVPAAAGCTEDNITVTATGTAVENSASCIAHVTVAPAADVSISPGYQTGLPEDNLNYTVTVTNTGNVTDNYSLDASDDAGWGPTLSDNLLEDVQPSENRTVTLSVIVPTDAIGCTDDNITVTATSAENASVSAENTCVAHATIVMGVDVSVLPTYDSAPPESDIIYTVTVANTGNAEDTYDLTPSDNAGWPLDVTPGSLTVPPSENRTATLTVTVPSNTPYCTEDNVTVTATGTGVSDNASCTAHADVLRRVEVAISPVRISAMPGGTLSYTVTVTNTGNVWDNYSLAASDTAGWSLDVSPPTMALAMGQSDNATLSVTVADVAPCTEDNVTVTATSQTDTVSDNDSCIAHRVKAEFSLATLYKFTLDIDFYLHTGAKIVAKFYTYGSVYQTENVVWSGTPPTQVTISEDIPHPENKPVEKVRLVLTDGAGAEIATIGTFTVTRDDLAGRVVDIYIEWPFASPEQRNVLYSEIVDIYLQWPFAPV